MIVFQFFCRAEFSQNFNSDNYIVKYMRKIIKHEWTGVVKHGLE